MSQIEPNRIDQSTLQTDTPHASIPATKTKAQRKKANRKANKRAANARCTELLSQCNALTHETIFSPGWFRPFQRYKRVYRVYYFASSDLSDDCLEWICLLTKINMFELYQNAEGWGWKDEGQTRGRDRLVRQETLCASLSWYCLCYLDKRAELRHPDARYFIVTRVDEPAVTDPAASSSSATPASSPPIDPNEFVGEPVAFCHVRFTTGDMDGAPIAYVYELQLESSLQRQGIGRFLMSLVELVAWRCQLSRVVLTVFRENVAATKFYTQTLNYSLDDTDPELWDQDEDYQILAKKNRKAIKITDIVLPLVPSAASSDQTATVTSDVATL